MRRFFFVFLVFPVFLPLSALSEEVDLPEGFKGVVPVYPNSKVTFSMTNEDGQQAHLEAAAKPKEIIDFYKNKLKGNGWGVGMEMAHEKGSTILFSKGDQALSVMVFQPEDSKTSIVLSLAKQE